MSKCNQCDIHKSSPYICVDDFIPQGTQILVVLSSLPFDLLKDNKSQLALPLSNNIATIKKMIQEQYPDKIIGFTSIIKCVTNIKPSTSQYKTCGSYLRNLLCQFRPEAFLFMGAVGLNILTGLKNVNRGNKIETVFGNGILTAPWMEAIHDANTIEAFKTDIKSLYSESKKLDMSKFSINIAKDRADVLRFYQILKDQPELVVDIEATNKPYQRSTHPTRILSVSFTYQDNEAFVIPLDTLVPVYKTTEERHLALKVITALIVGKARKTAHNGKYDFEYFDYAHGIKVTNFEDDTMYIAYLLNNKQLLGLKPLTNKYEEELFEYDRELDEYIASHNECNPHKNGSYLYVPNGILLPYNGLDTIACFRLKRRLKPILERNPKLVHVYRDIMLPVTLAYIDMEKEGLLYDREGAEKEGARLRTVISENTQALVTHLIQNELSANINLNAPEQIAEMLISLGEVQEWKGGEKEEGIIYVERGAKTGKLSCDESVINALVDKGSQVGRWINNLRKAESYNSKYIDKPLSMLDDDDILHPDMGITRTDTGRSSSGSSKEDVSETTTTKKSGFNTQNVTKKYRKYFIASKDKSRLLFARDFSQLELRLEAIIANVKLMLEIYRRGEDLHKLTASALKYLNNGLQDLVVKNIGQIDVIIKTLFSNYDTNFDKTTQKILRNQAKQPNFGFIYRGNHMTVMNKANLAIMKNIKDLYIELDTTFDKKDLEKIHEKIEMQRATMLTEDMAKQFETAFMTLFPEVPQFHKACENFSSKYGYILSPFGRIKPLPDALIRDFSNREMKSRYDHAINAATNHPIQSPGCDLKYLTMIEYNKRKKSDNTLDANICNEVHDDVMWNVSVSSVMKLFDVSSECMDYWHTKYNWLTIPIPSDAKVGFNWENMYELKDKNDLQQWLDKNL